MSPATVRTLYDDWLDRRHKLAAIEQPALHEQVQLRVLDYLLQRYRDDAAALEPAPPLLDAVYLNQRAIVVNHHQSFGLVAGVKSRLEANLRVASIMLRMTEVDRDAREGINLDRPAVEDDPWFGWEQPAERTLVRIWSSELFWLRRGWFRPVALKPQLSKMPFLPRALIDELSMRAADTNQACLDSAEALSLCRNRVAVDCIARAWRERVAAEKHDAVTCKLRDALCDWDRCCADAVRRLLADDVAEVRMAAAILLADVGDLRDSALLSDLLAMPPMHDEESAERIVLAQAMEKLVTRMHKDGSTPD